MFPRGRNYPSSKIQPGLGSFERITGSDSDVTRAGNIELPINDQRSDFFSPGPPILVYVIGPNGVEYRVRIVHSHGLRSNEIKKFPQRFNIKILDHALPRGPANPARPSLTGEIVKRPNADAEVRPDLPVAASREIEGGSPTSSTVTRLSLGATEVALSDNGKFDVEIDGESVTTVDRKKFTVNKQPQILTFPGGIKRGILRENEIAQLIPTTFVTPYPMHIPDWAFLGNAKRLVVGMAALMASLRK